MTPNELTHNATGDREDRRLTPLGTTTTKTFKVDSDGNITGDHNASAGNSLIVENKSGQSFTGAIYAARNNTNKTQQLVGASSMTVGTTYTIKDTAKGHSFSITSTQPSSADDGGPMDTTNGTLHVGSGNTDGEGDADGDGSGGQQ